MKIKIIRTFFVVLLGFWAVSLWGQSSLEQYRAEVGINGGGSFYTGDANPRLFSYMQPAFGAFLRYRFDTRTSLRAEWTQAIVAGYGMTNRTVNVVDFCGEFNFFDLEQNPYKRYSKPYSPYIFAGVGYVNGIMSMPFGVGFKLKLTKRLNFNAQWANRLLFSDNLENNDAFNNPNGLNGTNLFNNDFLSTVTVGLSYDLWKKECDCRRSSRRYIKR